MSEKFTIDRRRFLTGLGALGTAGALTACVGPTITSRGSATAGGGPGASALLLPAVDAQAGDRDDLVRPLASRGQGRLRHPHRDVRQGEPAGEDHPGHLAVERLPEHRAAEGQGRQHRQRLHRVPRRAVRQHGQGRPVCGSWRPAVRRRLLRRAHQGRPGPQPGPDGPALPAGLQHAHLQRGRLRQGRRHVAARGLGRVPRALREAQGRRARPDRVARRRAGELGPAHQLDGHEQHARPTPRSPTSRPARGRSPTTGSC